MYQRWTRIQLAVALSLLVAITVLPAVSAQEPNRQGNERNTTVESTFAVDPVQRSYTATDDLWTWRDRNTRQAVQTGSIRSVLTSLDSLERVDDPLWEPGDSLLLDHSMDLDLRYVPDMDSDSSGMAVKGRASGTLSQFRPEIDAEVIVGNSLQWDAKISGDGTCTGEDCEIDFVLTGPLSGERGETNCGELTVEASSFVDTSARSFGFKSVSGMDSETEVLNLWDANLRMNTSADGTSCFIGETEKNVLSSRVNFYYGLPTDEPAELRLGKPDVHRVMPGDNVTIIGYRGFPIQLLETLEGIGDTLWNPEHGPLTITHDMLVELRYTPNRDDSNSGSVILSGEVRGAFPKEWTMPNGLVADGTIAGRGVCDGTNCTIQIVRTLDILDGRSGSRCGTISTSETVQYVHGVDPVWTFGTDGTGSISLRNHQHCLLDSIADVDDISR